jgi:hypothetical protein
MFYYHLHISLYLTQCLVHLRSFRTIVSDHNSAEHAQRRQSPKKFPKLGHFVFIFFKMLCDCIYSSKFKSVFTLNSFLFHFQATLGWNTKKLKKRIVFSWRLTLGLSLYIKCHIYWYKVWIRWHMGEGNETVKYTKKSNQLPSGPWRSPNPFWYDFVLFSLTNFSCFVMDLLSTEKLFLFCSTFHAYNEEVF